LCDGFFLIIDPTKIESIFFIEKQIQSIIKYSSCLNFFLIANVRFLNLEFNKIKENRKKFAESDVYIKELVKKYDLKIHYINIENLKSFKNQIRKFLSISFIKKGMYNIKLNGSFHKKKTNSVTKSKNDRKSVNCVRYNEEGTNILDY
jgi:hypothetical protein